LQTFIGLKKGEVFLAAKKTKNNQSGTAIGIMVVGAMILVIAVVLLLTQGGASQPAAQLPAEDIPYPAVVRVSLEDAKAAYDQGEAVFVDVRSVDSYQAAHITGAISIPLAELETRLAEIPQDKWIITYCT
jgi:hypothetical protein